MNKSEGEKPTTDQDRMTKKKANQTGFYNNENVAESIRRNTSFQVTNAVREALTLALDRNNPVTYEQALPIIYDLSPSAYEGITNLLSQKNESDTVRLYVELAKARSTAENNISAKDLLDKDIKHYENIIEIVDHSESKQLRTQLKKLQYARDFFEEKRKIPEGRIIHRDHYLATHPSFGASLYVDDYYKDYRISNFQYLRMRLLHPDKEEAILGADLIYEQYDLGTKKVRFTHLQYKVWNRKSFNLSDVRMHKQINRMKSHLCDAGYCHGTHGKNNTKRYRFPYCSGFLRPTDDKQSTDSKLITTGYHFPICKAKKYSDKHTNIQAAILREQSLSSKIFEQTFTENKLGSRWIDISELEKFYKKTELLNLSESVRIHAMDVIIPAEADKYRKK